MSNGKVHHNEPRDVALTSPCEHTVTASAFPLKFHGLFGETDGAYLPIRFSERLFGREQGRRGNGLFEGPANSVRAERGVRYWGFSPRLTPGEPAEAEGGCGQVAGLLGDARNERLGGRFNQTPTSVRFAGSGSRGKRASSAREFEKCAPKKNTLRPGVRGQASRT
jgi:hypothetical protein